MFVVSIPPYTITHLVKASLSFTYLLRVFPVCARMSDTGTFKSGHTDDFTNGLNPMYQSLSVTTHQEQTEYDVINDSQSCLIKPPLPTRVTTCNSLYSSRSEATTIKHPTLNSSPGDFRFVPIPEISRFEEEKERPKCPCSCTAILCVVTLFNILLSGRQPLGFSEIINCEMGWVELSN